MKNPLPTLSLALLLTLVPGCHKTDSTSSSPPIPKDPSSSLDLSTPSKTVQSFGAALDAGDFSTAKKCVTDDPAQQIAIDQLGSAMTSIKNYKSAAALKFPQDSAADLKAMPDMTMSADLNGGVTEKIDPAANTATVSYNKPSTPDSKPLALKKVDNDWKIDLSATDDSRQMMQALPQIAASAEIYDTMTTNIMAGQFKSWADAQTALGMLRLQAAPVPEK